MSDDIVKTSEVAFFGGGCFWCTEAIFKAIRGVISAIPGYSGGNPPPGGGSPTYEQVSSGATGHAETVKIEFDPAQVSYNDLLEVFFATHDPTQYNRQGGDIGEQYRSVIFYVTANQQKQAREFIAQLEKDAVFASPIVTEVKPFTKFYDAEDYHRDYYLKNPNAGYCQIVINPKLEKFKKKFAALLK